jgi:hypothetical protein
MRSFDAYFTLEKLEVFCLVAKLQSVTRAAAQLCVVLVHIGKAVVKSPYRQDT